MEPTPACGDACDDAEDAAGGEGEATLTRTRLGANAEPADASDGRSHSLLTNLAALSVSIHYCSSFSRKALMRALLGADC